MHDPVLKYFEDVKRVFDAGATEDGKTKIVPSISLKLTNTGTEPIGGVQLNCIFRRVGDPEEVAALAVGAAQLHCLAVRH